MDSVIWHLLIFRAISPGSTVMRTNIISMDSAEVLLPCSNVSFQPVAVSWFWRNSSSENKHLISRLDNASLPCQGNTDKVTFNRADCFQSRDFSILLTPTLRDGGSYYCEARGQAENVYIRGIELLVFRVKVTPVNALTPGETVSFATELSEPIHTRDVKWDPRLAHGVTNQLGFQWTRDGAPIVRGSRYMLNSGTFNISCFQRRDSGEYTLTLTLNNRTAATYSKWLEVAGSFPEISLISGISLAVIGVLCLIASAMIVYKRPTVRQQNQPGNYVNIPARHQLSNQGDPAVSSIYTILNVNDRSLYSQLQR
ncbi:uncharacterized protein LOC122547443 [Chiloscyllium plagiosum]|uniref:uncharacterized protein LOC122547443 n=1 Tax=Chiloscyllium plagiosum TaxID=36176 RepID=UPI001CB7DFFE|nr:uncharacterized protein LOC122547443 [Chiloscyllium plagiosum]